MKMLYFSRCWVIGYIFHIFYPDHTGKIFLLRIQYYNVCECLKDRLSVLIAELLIESLNHWLLQHEPSIACLGNFCLNTLSILFQSEVIVLPLYKITSSTIFFLLWTVLCWDVRNTLNHLPVHLTLTMGVLNLCCLLKSPWEV